MWVFFVFFTPTQVRAAATKDWGLTKGELSSFNTIKSKTITSMFNTNSEEKCGFKLNYVQVWSNQNI